MMIMMVLKDTKSFFEDELPYYYQQPEDIPENNGEGNFI